MNRMNACLCVLQCEKQDTVCFLDNINMSAGVFLSLFSVLLSDNKTGAGAGHSAQRAVHSVSRGVDDESRICYSPPTLSSSVWRASQCILLARDSTSHLPWNKKENNFYWTIVKKNIWQGWVPAKRCFQVCKPPCKIKMFIVFYMIMFVESWCWREVCGASARPSPVDTERCTAHAPSELHLVWASREQCRYTPPPSSIIQHQPRTVPESSMLYGF